MQPLWMILFMQLFEELVIRAGKLRLGQSDDALVQGLKGKNIFDAEGRWNLLQWGVTTRIPQAIDQSCSHHRRGEQDDPPRPAGRHTCLDPADCNHAQHAGGRKAAVAIPRRLDISLRNPEATEFFDILNRLSDIGIEDISIETF